MLAGTIPADLSRLRSGVRPPQRPPIYLQVLLPVPPSTVACCHPSRAIRQVVGVHGRAQASTRHRSTSLRRYRQRRGGELRLPGRSDDEEFPNTEGGLARSPRVWESRQSEFMVVRPAHFVRTFAHEDGQIYISCTRTARMHASITH